MAMVVMVVCGSGWVVWPLGGEEYIEGDGEEIGEDVHGEHAMMQWMGRVGWIRSWQGG